MPRTVDIAAQAISLHQQEIAHLMSQSPVDHLAVEELLAACQRENRKLITAQNLVAAAPRTEPRPEVIAFMARFFPRSSTILTPGTFRAMKGAH